MAGEETQSGDKRTICREHGGRIYEPLSCHCFRKSNHPFKKRLVMRPNVIVLAGPNGAGKTTASRVILPKLVDVVEFVNADVIAQGLSGFAPENAALEAGRIMLARLHQLAEQQLTFAFETTLASRTFAPWLKKLLGDGYEMRLFFFWVPSAEFSIARVANRVKLGGHYVDPETIRRRYDRGLQNFFNLYQSIATEWFVYNNTVSPGEVLVARGRGRIVDEIEQPELWKELRTKYDSSYQVD
ncbi:MAG TPA: zeta toxin family protein [Pirellulaceae bacterium]|jgi:predicted ABC-type ATPase